MGHGPDSSIFGEVTGYSPGLTVFHFPVADGRTRFFWPGSALLALSSQDAGRRVARLGDAPASARNALGLELGSSRSWGGGFYSLGGH